MGRACVVCGAEIQRKERPDGKGRWPITCSSECRRSRHARREVESRWASRGGPAQQPRTCARCGAEFVVNLGPGKLGRGPGLCSPECRRAQHLERARENQAKHRRQLGAEALASRRRTALLARYGLTAESYAERVAAQRGVCAICRRPETKHHSELLKIDHDRSCCGTGRSCGRCVRALLCSNCNRALGLFGDDPAVLRSAAEYLERFASRG